MFKIFRTYFPMVISILFFFVYSLMLSAVIFYNDFLENETYFLGFLVLFVFLMVACIWGEIIYFIVKAAKDKDLKNNVLWCFMIYLFNVFIIPYFNLKYIIRDSKIKSKMVWFIILSICALVGGALIPSVAGSKSFNEPFYLYSDEEPIKFKFNGNYIEREVGEYDLYVSDLRRQINMGLFVYEEDELLNSFDILSYRDEWIRTSRDNVELIDEYTKEFEDKTIISKVYAGDKEGERFIYKISTVSFKYSEAIVNFIQVCYDEDYATYRSELEQALLDVEYIGSKEL